MEIAAGRYTDVTNDKTYVVLNTAQHTEGHYKMVIMHEEGHPEQWKATPITVFHERVQKGGSEIPRFKKAKIEAVQT